MFSDVKDLKGSGIYTTVGISCLWAALESWLPNTQQEALFAAGAHVGTCASCESEASYAVETASWDIAIASFSESLNKEGRTLKNCFWDEYFAKPGVSSDFLYAICQL